MIFKIPVKVIYENVLLIQSGELRGCINDVQNIKRLIQSRGFTDSYSTMRILTDDNRDPSAQPTRQNIIEGTTLLKCFYTVNVKYAFLANDMYVRYDQGPSMKCVAVKS